MAVEQELLERLSRFYELRSLLVLGRHRGFLEKGEALRMIKLLREIILDLSGGETPAILHLLDAAEEVVREPGDRIKKVALEKFGRSDVIPMPEHIVKALPEPPILKLIRRFPMARRLVGLIAKSTGLNPRVVETLLNVRLRDLASEIGYQVELLFEVAGGYARRLEDYILNHGLGRLKVTGSLLSVFAEVTGRTWLSVVKKGPWLGARPLARQANNTQYEFDAVAYDIVENRVELYVAEIELRCNKFLELEKKVENKGISSLEGKVSRLNRLIDNFKESFRHLGINKACLKNLILICYDNPPETIKNEVFDKARSALLNPRPYSSKGEEAVPLCPNFELEIIDGNGLTGKLRRRPPENRLKEAIDYIVNSVTTGKPR